MLSNTGKFRVNSPTTECKKKFYIFRGLLYAMLSGVFYCMISVMVKQMKNLHPGQLALYRMLSLLVLSLPQGVKTGQNLLGPRKLRLLITIRGITSGISVFFGYIAFRYLELGEASVIIFSSPMVVTIFARVFFKEPCTIFQSIIVILTFIGLVFTTKLPSTLTKAPFVYSSEKIYGFLAAFGSLGFVSVSILITRKVRSVPTSILNVSFNFSGALVTVILTAVFGNFKLLYCGIQRIYILVLALLSYISITLFVMAIQCEFAGPVITMRGATDIISAFVSQYLIFNDVPDSSGIIGAVLVFIAVILMTVEKWLTTLPSYSLFCEQFKCYSI